tara:strand:- start:1722 stop:1922 length:201 start_codon:yes stop_codon:yes gene_type:complete
MLEIKDTKDKYVLDILIHGEKKGFVLRNRPKNQIARSIHYLVNQVDPSISRDLIEYELDLILKDGE